MAVIRHGNPDVSRAERGACAFCDVYENCIFHMPRYGGFRGQGERYVRYRLITDPSENENAKEDFLSCVAFVAGGLMDRMHTGREQRQIGRKGEVITILTDQSNCVTQGMEMGFNSRGEIVNAMPNLIEDLKASGYKVSTTDKGPAVTFEQVRFKRHVPPFKKPQPGRSSYSQEIAARAADLDREEQEAEDALWAERMGRGAEPVAAPVAAPAAKKIGKTLAELVQGDDDE